MSNRQREQMILAFEKWGYDTRGWTPSTGAKYRRIIRSADRWLTEHRDTSIIWAKWEDLKAFLFSRSPNAITRNGVRQALVAWGAYMVEEDIATFNEALRLPRLPVGRPLPKALNRDQSRRIHRSARARGRMVYALICILLYSALRRREALRLEWRQVDLDEGWVRFIGKGRKDRSVPLSKATCRALSEWRTECDSPRWVFPSPRNGGHRPISETWLWELMQDIGREVGIDGLHAHKLRHTAATRMLEQGANLRTVQEFLGHASPGTTAIYTYVRPAKLKEAVDNLSYEDDPEPSGGRA